MKFLRQFGAVVVVVAVVVLGGLAWSRLAPSLPGEGPGGRALVVPGQVIKELPPGARLSPGGAHGAIRINNGSGIPSLLLGDLLNPGSLVVLRNNALLEAVVIAAVVLADASYLRLRRARRAR